MTTLHTMRVNSWKWELGSISTFLYFVNFSSVYFVKGWNRGVFCLIDLSDIIRGSSPHANLSPHTPSDVFARPLIPCQDDNHVRGEHSWKSGNLGTRCSVFSSQIWKNKVRKNATEGQKFPTKMKITQTVVCFHDRRHVDNPSS